MDKKIENWMRGVLLNAARPCCEFRLEHVQADGETTLASAYVDQEKDKEGQLQGILGTFTEAVEAHSHEFQRTQRYSVIALSEGNRVIAAQTFRVKPPADMHDTGESDPPNAAGITALQLRASEAMMRMLLTSIAAQTEQQSRMVQSAYSRIADLESQRMKDFDQREQLMGTQHERDLENFVAQSAEERKDRLFKRAEQVLAPLLPELLSKMKILPPTSERKNGARLADQLKAFVSSLDEQQQDVLFKTLRPEQAAILYSMMPDEPEPTPDPKSDTEH